MDAQGADYLQEGSDNSEEHIKRVELCEDNREHIQMIAHEADALEHTSIVYLDNDIGHDDDGLSFS